MIEAHSELQPEKGAIVTPEVTLIVAVIAVCVFALGALFSDLVNRPELVRKVIGVGAVLVIGVIIGQPIASFRLPDASLAKIIQDHQTLVAALIALGAAGIAYQAQTSKTRSDERSREHDRVTMYHTIKNEIQQRLIHTVLALEGYRLSEAAHDRLDDEFGRLVFHVLSGMSKAAQSTINRAWADIPKCPSTTQNELLNLVVGLERLTEAPNMAMAILERSFAEKWSDEARMKVFKMTLSRFSEVATSLRADQRLLILVDRARNRAEIGQQMAEQARRHQAGNAGQEQAPAQGAQIWAG